MSAYFDAAMTVCKAIQKGKNEGEEERDFTKRIGNLFQKAGKERAKLLGDPKIVEEMGT